MREEELRVRPEEEKRAFALSRLVAGRWTEAETGLALGLSVRQVRRLKKRYEAEGIRSLIHGNRGKGPWNRWDEGTKERVQELARTKYVGVNDQHLTELLEEREGIRLSRSSVRRMLREGGLASPRKRRSPKHRSRRERMAQEGMLIQIDGSRHDWLEGRGPYLTLIGGIDDATGKVPYAIFREQEDAQGYFRLLEHIVRHEGVPLALYRDRHGIFERTAAAKLTLEEQFAKKPALTQFGRLLEELEITSIPAQSPQAKGRIERLWGTFQDRLVTELRLQNTKSIGEANQMLGDFLPRFNSRFAVPAAMEGVAYRPLPSRPLEELFCFKYVRTVAADNTVQLGEHRLQLLPGRGRVSFARCHVEVHERIDGSLAVYYQGEQLALQAAPLEAPKLRARQYTRPALGESEQDLHQRMQTARYATPARQDGKPTPAHPWKRSHIRTQDKIAEQLTGQNP
jgi:transposase